MTIFTRTLKLDLVINYASFAITALSGVAFLFLLAHYLGMAGLGVVSLVLALYGVIGQIAVGGIQFSALRVASQQSIAQEEKVNLIYAAFITAGLWSALIAFAIWFANDLFASLFESPRVAEALLIVSPALVLFALNKTAASTLNGLNHMRLFALQMMLRTILLAGFSWPLAAMTGDPVLVCWAIVGSELGVTLYLFFQLLRLTGIPKFPCLSYRLIRRHLSFGLRGLWSGLAFVIDTRLDVIVVGFFLTDAEVGLYALVAQLAEGFFNILIVVRNQLAPVLGKLMKPLQVDDIQRLARAIFIIIVPIAALSAFVGVWLYAPVMQILFPGQGYEAGASLLAILLVGLVLNSWLFVLDILLIVGGYPGSYSLLMFLTVATNMAANLTLVPMFGLHGAALATALASLSWGGYFLLVSRKRFGFWLPAKPQVLKR